MNNQTKKNSLNLNPKQTATMDKINNKKNGQQHWIEKIMGSKRIHFFLKYLQWNIFEKKCLLQSNDNNVHSAFAFLQAIIIFLLK